MSKQWCIPPKANAEFVWKMEDVLEVYKRPYDPRRPVVCLDETSKQSIGETRTPVASGPGRVAHYDSEYVRNGLLRRLAARIAVLHRSRRSAPGGGLCADQALSSENQHAYLFPDTWIRRSDAAFRQ